MSDVGEDSHCTESGLLLSSYQCGPFALGTLRQFPCEVKGLGPPHSRR